MAGITSNLYPPIINTYNPAFVISEANTVCRIYFSLSMYNSIEELKNAQVTCCQQKTNASVLKKDAYPSGIKLCQIGIDKDRHTEDRYYIELMSTDLQGGFQINQYYKIQIRFTSVSAPNPESSTAISGWLANNSDYFSEWSTICLVRGISQPILELIHLDAPGSGAITLTQSTLTLVGSLSFTDKNEQDTLKSYHARLYNTGEELLSDSGDQYSNTYSNINEINYTFNYMLEDGMSYKLSIDIETQNGYTMTKHYEFTVIQNTLDKLPAVITMEAAPEIGSIRVKMDTLDAGNFTGYVMFRRTSSRSNFTVWEDIHKVAFNEAVLKYVWYDYTVESGVWYKYCAQRVDSMNNRGIVTISEAPAMTVFDDMFVCANKKQLRIKYNPQINSFKRNIAESKIDTIGSKYPFIKRNGAMEYRQFSLSGLITLHTDYQDTFTSKDELYGNNQLTQLYDNYNVNNKINEYNDNIHEREFRQKVMDFLYDDNVKLLRTTTEGNILIKLMDITLTPETTLGRMLYSFSATAYEVDEYSIDTLNKYNINGGMLYIGTDSEQVNPDETLIKQVRKFGQLHDTVAAEKDVVTSVLTKKYEYLTEEGFITTVDHLDKIKIEFQSKPYLIHEDATQKLVPVEEENISNPLPLEPGAYADNTTVLGYLMYINNTPIYVNPDGVYELDNVSISSIYFPVDTEVSIDYIAIIHKTETFEHKTDILYFYNRVGQLWGTFEYKDSVFHQIWNKYYGEYKKYSQKLLSINGVRIEADPGIVFWLKDSTNKKLKRFVMNDAGLVSYFDNDAVIEGLFFSGIHLYEASPQDLRRDILPENKYYDTGITVNSLDEIEQPMINGVYTLANAQNKITLDMKEEDIQMAADDIYTFMLEKTANDTDKYIYYNGQWQIFTSEHDILCSVDAIVDYWCEIVRGVHAI